MSALQAKIKYGNLSVNGYNWFGFFGGFHHFSKCFNSTSYGYIKLLDEDKRKHEISLECISNFNRKFSRGDKEEIFHAMEVYAIAYYIENCKKDLKKNKHGKS
jgi:hypothetical protein